MAYMYVAMLLNINGSGCSIMVAIINVSCAMAKYNDIMYISMAWKTLRWSDREIWKKWLILMKVNEITNKQTETYS